MLPECPRCHITADSSKAQYCPRCGGHLGAGSIKPVHIERAGRLLNTWFLASLVVLLAGAVLASMGSMSAAALLLGVGVLALLITTIRSQGRREGK